MTRKHHISKRHIRIAESTGSLDFGLLDLRGKSEAEVLRYLQDRVDDLGVKLRRRFDGRDTATTGPLGIWLSEDWCDEPTSEKCVTLAHELGHTWQWWNLRAFGVRYWMSLGFRWAVEVASRRAGLLALYALGRSAGACRNYARAAARSLMGKTYGRLHKLGPDAEAKALEILNNDIEQIFKDEER